MHPLELWPLALDGSHVAEQLGGATSPPRAAKRVRKGVDDWKRHRMGTLRVTASTEPGAWYGFSFGVGWVYRALEARKRSRGSVGNFVSAFGRLAADTLAEDDETSQVAIRTTVDYRPLDDQSGSLIASTLQRSPFGFGAGGDGAVLWTGMSPRQILRRAVTPDMLDTTGGEGRRFETVHLDTPDGWLLDGRLFGSDRSGVVQVVPGPTVTLVQPQGKLKAMVSKLGK